MIRVSRAADSIWHTADLEHGDPYEDDDEAGWFRDKKRLMSTVQDPRRDEELMTLVPGWDEAKRRGWKPFSGAISPMAYRGTGDRFEVIAPKHVSPDEDHWDRIPQRWIRYSQGEGGMRDPYVMHANTFKDATNDRNLPGWNLYKSEYDPETEQYSLDLNDKYPKSGSAGAGVFVDVFNDYQGGPGYFDHLRAQAEKREKRARGEV